MAGLLVDWRPFRTNRNFRLIITGQLISLMGSNITQVAIPYQVYRETHSSLWVGVSSVLQLPFLIGGALLGGAYGDRFDKRKLLLIGTAICALVDVGLAINAAVSGSRFIVLVAFASLMSAAAGFTGPVRSSSLPTILGDDLIAGYSLFQIVLNSAAIAGPSLAGVILGSFQLRDCYIVDAATFGFLLLQTSRLDPLPRAVGVVPSALRHAISDGFRYVRSHAIAQTIYLADLNAMVFGLPRALFPAVALTLYHGGPRTLGLLYAAPAAGGVIFAVLTGWVERVQRRGRLVVLAVIGYGIAMALFGLVHVLWFGLLVLGIAGGMDVLSTVVRNTILQLAITDEFRSRISSIQMAVVQGGPRLGDGESGLVAALTTTEFSIVSGGMACVVGVAYLAWRRRYFWNTTNEVAA